MSLPTLPNIVPQMSVNREQVINVLLASIAVEELGLTHLVNTGAENIQYVLHMLTRPRINPTIPDLLAINQSIHLTLREALKKEVILQFKLKEVISVL